jgi:hypothetical protein
LVIDPPHQARPAQVAPAAGRGIEAKLAEMKDVEESGEFMPDVCLAHSGSAGFIFWLAAVAEQDKSQGTRPQDMSESGKIPAWFLQADGMITASVELEG